MILSLTVYNYYNIMIIANHAKHVINEEKSRDQDELNQASVRSVCKIKYFQNIKRQSTKLTVTLIH